jgi:hypothetical protein
MMEVKHYKGGTQLFVSVVCGCTLAVGERFGR